MSHIFFYLSVLPYWVYRLVLSHPSAKDLQLHHLPLFLNQTIFSIFFLNACSNTYIFNLHSSFLDPSIIACSRRILCKQADASRKQVMKTQRLYPKMSIMLPPSQIQKRVAIHWGFWYLKIVPEMRKRTLEERTHLLSVRPVSCFKE